MPWNDFSPTVRMLALMGRGRPEVYDVFPSQGIGARVGVDAASLNPQPLPPKDPLVQGAVTMSRRLAELAVEAEVRGEQPAEWLTAIIDEWCDTPWPRKWPWPGPGPDPESGPQPEPWTVNEARTAGAVVLASMASRLGEGELRAVLARGAERLADAAAQEI